MAQCDPDIYAYWQGLKKKLVTITDDFRSSLKLHYFSISFHFDVPQGKIGSTIAWFLT